MKNPTFDIKHEEPKVVEEKENYTPFTLQFMSYIKQINKLEDYLNLIKEYIALKYHMKLEKRLNGTLNMDL